MYFYFFGYLEDLLGLKAVWNLQYKSGFLNLFKAIPVFHADAVSFAVFKELSQGVQLLIAKAVKSAPRLHVPLNPGNTGMFLKFSHY